MKALYVIVSIVFASALSFAAPPDPGGFNGALWGDSPENVRKNTTSASWQPDPSQQNFPPELMVKVFRAPAQIAGHPASVTYYFVDDRFFQATVDFAFPELVNFDFNYNVFRSVNEYYTAIRHKTILFVNDIYDLLLNKYGKRKPVFKGLDPRFCFERLDHYVMKERWNLRYNPYDFYLNIVTASYARWDFPRTSVIFSVNIAAPQKRFDYRLSLSSTEMSGQVKKAMDIIRAKNL